MLPAVRNYVLNALEGTPDVLDAFLLNFRTHDLMWNIRPDPARFTLREVVAHLADWEPIFLDRLTRMLHEENPTLENYDEGQIAIDRAYGQSDPHANLVRFRAGRAALLSLLRSLDDTGWQRIGYRVTLGQMTIEDQAVQILGHDGYHTRQVALWLGCDAL